MGALVVILGLTWVFQGNDFFMYRVFAPRYADAQRNTFENSQSYVDGKIAYLSELRAQYEDSHRESTRTLILSEASQIDNAKLPRDLRVFIEGLKEKGSEFE